MGDLITGMVVPGIVRNVTRFGAVVDIGIEEDGVVGHAAGMEVVSCQ